MTAAATARPSVTSRASSKRPTASAATPQTRGQELAWLETLSSVLGDAANTDEAENWSGESTRLLRVAHELADQLHIRPEDSGNCGSLANRAFTIAALVKAALKVPGDTPSAERLALIEQARPALVGLTEDPAVLDGWETNEQANPSAESADNRPAEQREVMRAICAHVSHAETVAQVVSETCDVDLAWGAIYALRNLHRRLTGMEQQQDYGKGHRSVFSDAYCEISCFLQLLMCVNHTAKIDLFEAVATLLQAGCEAAEQMVDSLVAQDAEALSA